MPGVPSSRGCNSCRKQKKKCDQAHPACARCARLKIPCVGAGQLRYKFQLLGKNGKPEQAATSKLENDNQQGLFQLITLPETDLSRLVAGLILTIKPSTDLRYNIMWAFGDFFADVPQRLGKNGALDAAAAVLVSGHNDMRMHKGQVSLRTLRLHGHALSILRACLNDPVEAQAVNTLCAVYLLLICQSLTGTWDSWTPSHTEGAVQILRSKNRYGVMDGFEKKLLLTLRGPVIFEGMFNPRIDLSPDEWELLLFDNRKCTRRIDRILVYLADMPSYLRRGTDLKAGVYSDPNFVEVVRSRYSAIKVAADELHTLLITFEAENSIQDDNALIHLTYQRIYGLALFVTLVLNCLLSALTEPSDLIALEAEAFAHDVILLASQSHRYRPLGSAYITICLYGAFAAARQQATKDIIFREIERYCSDFPPPKDTNHLEVVQNSVRHLTLS